MRALARRSDEAIAEFEQAVLEAVPVDVEHVADETVEAYDAILRETIRGNAVDPTFFVEETPLELKTCVEWIEDRHNTRNRRRGRWWIGRRAHDRLVELDGAYLLVVLDDDRDDDPVEAVLVSAEVLDRYLADRWTGNGNGGPGQGGRSAQLPWSAVIDPAELDLDVEADTGRGSA